MLARFTMAFGRPLRRSALFFLLLLLAACQGDQERSGAQDLKPSAQAAAGTAASREADAERVRRRIFKSYGPRLVAPTLQPYVNDLGLALARDLGAEGQVRLVEVLDSTRPNAMALFDGTIYVTRGLLALMNDEDELAAVLTHEIGHLVRDHRLERDRELIEAARAAGLKPTSESGAIWSCNLACKERFDEALDALYRDWADDELEADAYSLEGLSAVGRSPEAALSFLERLHAYRSLPEGGGVPEVSQASSAYGIHPAEDERIAAMKRGLAALPAQTAGLGTVPGGTSSAFLRQLDGLRYLRAAQVPQIQGRNYTNPLEGYGLRLPQGFAFRLDPFGAVGERPDGTWLTIRRPRDFQDKPETLVREKGLFEHEVETQTHEPLGERTLVRATLLHPAPVDRARYFVLLVPGTTWTRTFTIMAGAPGRDPESLDPMLLEMASSLRVFEPRRLARTPYLKLTEVGAGDTEASLAARMVPRDGHELERFRLLNGLAPGEALRPGQTVKLVVDDR